MEQHFFEHFVPLLVTCTIGCLPQRTLESNGFIITSIMRKSESTTFTGSGRCFNVNIVLLGMTSNAICVTC